MQQTRHRCNCTSLRTPRKLHAVSGALFGLFVIAHLTINALSLHKIAFGGAIGLVHGAIAVLPWITLPLIFLPLLFQIGSGLYLLHKEGLIYHTGGCNRGSTLRYFLQRLTGPIILLFVLLHLGTLHNWGWHRVDHDAQSHTGYLTQQLFPAQGVVLSLFFLTGVAAMAYHLANGAITGNQVWGIIRRDAARKRWRHICAITGLALFLAAMAALIGFGIPGMA